MPVVNLNWKISDLTPKTIISFTKELKKEFSRLKIGELKIDASIASENYSEILSKLSDVNHQMGGAVFGNDSKLSILDKNLRVHEIENLYVASCASFPSFSHSNPTLTLLALVDKMQINFNY
jgi:choline dehydrogenase-like flavoprotein